MSLSTPLAAPSLPSTPVWTGSSALQETSDSPQITVNKDGRQYVKILMGPWDAIQAAVPARLSAMSGAGGLLVDTAIAKNGPGGIGTLTITCCNSPSPGIPSDGTSSPTEEVEWVEVQRPLKSHKMFQAGGVAALTLPDLSAIQVWQNQADPVSMAAFTYPTDAGPRAGTLSTNAKIYATKWLRGQEIYNEYAPVFRSTVALSSQPETGDCGLIGSPVATESTPPSDYQWLKNADRCLKRSKTWERVQEWLGAWWWDPDIYDSADTGASVD